MYAKPIYICHYNHDPKSNTCHWLLTDCEIEAKTTDQSYQLASIEDLNDWACVAPPFIGILSVREGQCKWMEYDYIGDFGEVEYECGYYLI